MQISSEYIERWLTLQANLGRAPNTIAAYSYALRDYQQFCCNQNTCVTLLHENMFSNIFVIY